jgi:hypothetical protein
MFGPIDVDSLDFQTRIQIMRISELTGVSRDQVVARAVEELYRRVIAARDQKIGAAPRTDSKMRGRGRTRSNR